MTFWEEKDLEEEMSARQSNQKRQAIETAANKTRETKQSKGAHQHKVVLVFLSSFLSTQKQNAKLPDVDLV